MKIHEIMTGHPHVIGPENTLVEAAGLMRELDVGVLPVCERGELIGIVTDRDMIVRAIADGLDPSATMVSEVMSGGAEFVFADQEVEHAAQIMEHRQIRRLPVVDREKRVIGIVSLSDIAISSNIAFSGLALRDISAPRHPSARQNRLQRLSEPPGSRLFPARQTPAAPTPSTNGGGGDGDHASSEEPKRNRQRHASGKGGRRSRGSLHAKSTTRTKKSTAHRTRK